MTHSSRYDSEERDFLAETLSRDVFSACEAARKTRAQELGFDRATLCDRIGKDKTGVSKLLSGPGNWTLRTLSDYANSLDLDVVVTLVDRVVTDRFFCREGVKQMGEYLLDNYTVAKQQNAQLVQQTPISMGISTKLNTQVKTGAVEVTHGNRVVY